jgi:hypothetical protein
VPNNLLTGDEPETVEARRDSLGIEERAIKRGVPFRGMDGEGDACVCAAVALAKTGQTFFRPDPHDDIWKITLMEDLLCRSGVHWDMPTFELMQFIEDGRPLFRKRIATGWSYYGYLSLNEVSRLAAGIRKAQKEHPMLADPNFFDGFLTALLGRLDKIAKKKLDLWFYTA